MAQSSKKKQVADKIARPNKKMVVAIMTSKKVTPKKNIQVKKVLLKEKQKKRNILPLTEESINTDVKIFISDNTQVKDARVTDTRHPVVRANLPVAILSPFRFPVPNEKFISNVARFAGVFFVVVGGFFSLLNLELVSGVQIQTNNFHNTALLTDFGGNRTTSSTNINSTLTKPEARISVESNGTQGTTIPITITVPSATGVTVIAIFKQDDHYETLGTATKVDDSTWRYYWDTKQFMNGEYLLKTVVKNSYGSYGDTHAVTHTVSNHSDVTTTLIVPLDEARVTRTTGSTTGNIVATPPVGTEVVATEGVRLKVSDNPSPLSGQASLFVYAKNATEIKLYARNTSSYSLYYIGQATRGEEDEWKFDWDTRDTPNGTYTLQAKAKLGNTQAESPRITTIIKNVVAPTLNNATATETTIKKIETVTEALEPDIAMSFSSQSPLKGHVDVLITTSGVEWIEVYALPKNSLTPFFLGLAKKITTTDWKFIWSTKQTPNGDYMVYTRVKSKNGFVDGPRKSVRVANEVTATYSIEEERLIETISDVRNSLAEVRGDTFGIYGTDLDTTKTQSLQSEIYIEPVDTFVETIEVEDESREEISLLLTEFKTELSTRQDDLARAIRTQDTESVERIKNELNELKDQVVEGLPASTEKKDIIDSISAYASQITFQHIEVTTNNEKIIHERIGDMIFNDSDRDSISDYDEINVYRTNPFTADTDGDGYIDSSEITRGFDPLDSASEAILAYESPKEVGVVREDILTVESITTLPNEVLETKETVPPAKALMAGKALPNSFVTLYIFSTPIVVTVKTDDEGNWLYIFDKDIEEGEHEVYVGLTDNEGKIIAKSNSFTFVKTAEAFTEANGVALAPVYNNSEPSLLDQNLLLLIASISVVALGLVLILLGIHVKYSHRDRTTLPAPV